MKSAVSGIKIPTTLLEIEELTERIWEEFRDDLQFRSLPYDTSVERYSSTKFRFLPKYRHNKVHKSYVPESILKQYIDKGIVTLKMWTGNQAQMTAYKDFYDNYRHETQWVSFLDPDEFICPNNKNNMLFYYRL